MQYLTAVFAPYTGRREYTYYSMLDIKPGDYAVVETPSNGYQVVKVRQLIEPQEFSFPIKPVLLVVPDTEHPPVIMPAKEEKVKRL